MRFQGWLGRNQGRISAGRVVKPDLSSIATFPSAIQERQCFYCNVGVQQDAKPVPPHPINITPPGVLGEIFIHCLSLKDLEIPRCPRGHEAPMLLCQVCSHWRQVALSLPNLWSSFSGNLGEHMCPSHTSLIQLLSFSLFPSCPPSSFNDSGGERSYAAQCRH